MQEFWDTFLANDSYFFSQESHPSTETFGDYSNWFTPFDDKYKSFKGKNVLQERDISVEFSLPNNPIFSHGSA
jgi:hypothetical protein